MQKWTIDQMPSQAGKVAVVTGANSGIGYETALGLARKGMEVIMACRDLQKAEKARSEILRECPEASVRTMKLDLSRLLDVEEFASRLQAKYATLF